AKGTDRAQLLSPQDVDVHVEHFLSPVAAHVAHQAVSRLVDALDPGHLARRGEQLRHTARVVRRHLGQRVLVRLGDDQDVDRGPGGDVAEGEHGVGLVDRVVRDLSRDDLAEEAVVRSRHACHRTGRCAGQAGRARADVSTAAPPASTEATTTATNAVCMEPAYSAVKAAPTAASATAEASASLTCRDEELRPSASRGDSRMVSKEVVGYARPTPRIVTPQITRMVQPGHSRATEASSATVPPRVTVHPRTMTRNRSTSAGRRPCNQEPPAQVTDPIASTAPASAGLYPCRFCSSSGR